MNDNIKNLKSILVEADENEEIVCGVFSENFNMNSEKFKGIDIRKSIIKNCLIEKCKFEWCHFDNVEFQSCDFTMCHFESCNFQNCSFRDCKFTGVSIEESYIKKTSYLEGDLSYITFTKTKIKDTIFLRCNLKFSEFNHCFYDKKVLFDSVNMSCTRFLKTSLKNIDVSTCEFEGVYVSDNFEELVGLKVNVYQAANLAKLLGVEILT